MAIDVNTTPRLGYDPLLRRRASRDSGGDDLDWLGFGRVLWRRKLFLFGFLLVVLGITAAWVSRVPPTYEAQAMVMLNEGERRLVPTIEGPVPGLAPNEERLQGQVLLIRSRGMADRLVNELNLHLLPEFNPAIRPQTSSLSGLLDPIKLIPPAVFEIIPRSWAEAMMKATSPIEMTDQQQAELLRAEIIENVLRKIRAEPANRSTVLTLKFESVDPSLAALGANKLADLYLTQQLESKQSVSQQDRAFLEAEIVSLRQDVAVKEQAIQNFRREHGLIERQGERSGTEQQMAELRTREVAVRAQLQAAEARLRQVESLLSNDTDLESAARLLDSPILTGLLTREIEIGREIAELSQDFGERHPRMISLRAEQSALQDRKRLEIEQIAQRQRNEVQVFRSEQASLRESIRGLERGFQERGEHVVELERMEREAQAQRDLLGTYLDRLQEIASLERAQQPDARIISRAVLPDQPTYPQRGLIFGIAFFGALLSGSLLVFGLEGLDNTFRSSEQIEDMVGLPTLGLVPLITDLDRRTGTPEDYVIDNPNSPFGEAVRSLRTALLLTGAGTAPRTVLLTSSVPGEGKTSMAMCLARINARAGRKTLLIDCDLRRPRLHELSGVENGIGLSDVLIRNQDLQDVLLADERSGAYFITAGAPVPDPAAILASERMRKLLKEVTGRYDLVILDSPPVLSVSDARVLSQVVDKTLFLVHWGSTRRTDVMMGVKQLIEAGADMAGLVLSRVNVKKHAKYGYRDSGYYYDDKYTKYYHSA
jgi:polysaccharide biosynthesis transport protein